MGNLAFGRSIPPHAVSCKRWAWTAGGVFGPGTKIGIDTSPLNPASKLQHVMLHGYLIRSGKTVPAAKAKRQR